VARAVAGLYWACLWRGERTATLARIGWLLAVFGACWAMLAAGAFEGLGPAVTAVALGVGAMICAGTSRSLKRLRAAMRPWLRSLPIARSQWLIIELTAVALFGAAAAALMLGALVASGSLATHCALFLLIAFVPLAVALQLLGASGLYGSLGWEVGLAAAWMVSVISAAGAS
jgi:hypothetical protein